jgi:hypothetical protein
VVRTTKKKPRQQPTGRPVPIAKGRLRAPFGLQNLHTNCPGCIRVGDLIPLRNPETSPSTNLLGFFFAICEPRRSPAGEELQYGGDLQRGASSAGRSCFAFRQSIDSGWTSRACAFVHAHSARRVRVVLVWGCYVRLTKSRNVAKKREQIVLANMVRARVAGYVFAIAGCALSLDALFQLE